MARGSEGWSGQRRRAATSPRRWASRGASAPAAGRWLAALAEEAHGLPRHLSQHSGGMIVATRPLIDCCPVVPGRDGGPPDGHVGQGLLRGRGLPEDRPARAGDALGRRALRRARSPRAAASGSTSRASPTTTRRPSTAIQEAETIGVFQIESRAQMGSLRRTRPENLDDLTIQVAIVRPGPIQGGAVNPYIERRQRLREDPDYEVPYDHPSLEPVLRDTLGTIIFQDQVIEVAMAFAGFSPGEAEGLRRAMSRKRSAAAIEAHHRGFVEGAMAQLARRRRGAGRARVVDGRRLLGLRLPQGPRRGLRPARLPVDVAARPLRPRVPVRAAQRAADGLLPARRARPRGAAARHRDPRARRQRERGRVHGRRSRAAASPASRAEGEGGAAHPSAVRLGLGYVLGVRGRRGRRARRRPRAPAARSARSTTSPRARARAARRSPSSPGRAPATRSPAGAGARRCGAWASPRPAYAAGAGARSSRCRSSCPRRPRSRALGDVGRR